MHYVTRKPCDIPAGAGEPSVPIDCNNVDDQGVFLPVTHRITIELGRWIFWMRASIGPDVAEGCIQFSQYDDFLVSLNDLQWIWVFSDKSRDTERLTSQAGFRFLLRSKSLLLQCYPGLERRTRLRPVFGIESAQGWCALGSQIEVSGKTHEPNAR